MSVGRGICLLCSGIALGALLHAAFDPHAAVRTFSLWLLVVMVGIAAFGAGHARGRRAAVRELLRFHLKLLQLAEILRLIATGNLVQSRRRGS